MTTIRAITVASDGSVVSDVFTDRDQFLADNADLPDIAALRRALHHLPAGKDPLAPRYRIDIMGGSYCDVWYVNYPVAKQIARHEYRHSLRQRDMEYRVAPLDGSNEEREAAAYYTKDLADALGTARRGRDQWNATHSRDELCL